MAKKKGNSITFILISLLIISLFGFGVTNFGGSSQAVATVGDTEVTASDYARAVEAQLNGFRQQTGQSLTFQQGQAFGVDRMALGQLITEAAVENETGRLGISAGDDRVAAEIQGISSFHNLSGEFDRQTYELALRQSGLNADDFEADVRGDLAEAIVRRAIGAGLETPKVYIDTLFDYARETRDVTWARLTATDLPEPIGTPTEDQIAAYHKANPDQFTKPETKVIRYAWITPDQLAPSIEVDEEQVRTLYDTRIDEFVSPERRLVERLVFSDDAAAAAAKSQLDSGDATFDTLVADRGLSLGDVDLGDVSVSDLGPAGAEVFALSDPGVVGPLPSDLGPALYRMNGILAAEETTFEEARDDLAAEAAADRARRIILDTVPQVEDLLAGGADMSIVAERTDLEEGTIEWNEEVVEGIAAYTGFRSAAAAANPGDFAEVIELDDGGIATLTVEEVQAPALRPLDEVRDAVIDAWTLEETQTALRTRAEAIATEIREGQDMASGRFALNLNVDTNMLRDAFIEGTPPDFTTTVFGMQADDLAVLTADGDAWLVRLDRVNSPDGETAEATLLKQGFASQTQQELSNAVTNAFVQALVDQAGVELNSAALNAVNAQLP